MAFTIGDLPYDVFSCCLPCLNHGCYTRRFSERFSRVYVGNNNVTARGVRAYAEAVMICMEKPFF
jgi:hypothetical protein